MNIVSVCPIANDSFMLRKVTWSYKFSQCSPKVSPCGVIFCSIFAMNIDDYRSLRLHGAYAYLFIAKNFAPGAARADEKPGLGLSALKEPINLDSPH